MEIINLVISKKLFNYFFPTPRFLKGMEHSTKIDCKCELSGSYFPSVGGNGQHEGVENVAFRAFLRIRNQQRSHVAPEIMLFSPCDVLKQLGYADSPEAIL